MVAPSNAAWHHWLITYDGSSASNDPVVYVDGSSVTVTEVQAPTGTIVTSADAYLLGNNPTDIVNLNGRLAEFALFSSILSAGDAASLYNGGAGRRADTLATAPLQYWKLCGTASPEPNEIGGGSSGTVTRALQQTHPFSDCDAPAASPPSQYGALMILGIPC